MLLSVYSVTARSQPAKLLAEQKTELFAFSSKFPWAALDAYPACPPSKGTVNGSYVQIMEFQREKMAWQL